MCVYMRLLSWCCLFFVNVTADPEIYTYGHTRSLHDAHPISGQAALVDAAREAIGDAPAVADLFVGVGTFALSVQAGRKVYAAEGARDAIAALTGAANRARGSAASRVGKERVST